MSLSVVEDNHLNNLEPINDLKHRPNLSSPFCDHSLVISPFSLLIRSTTQALRPVYLQSAVAKGDWMTIM